MEAIQAIKEFLSVRFTLSEAADLIENESKDSNLALILIDITQDKDIQFGFRAGWLLEMLVFKRPELFTPYFTTFFQAYSNQKNLSVLRHITKIMIFIQGPKSPIEWKFLVKETESEFNEQLIEVHFAWLIEQKIPVAIRANCMDILYEYGKKEPWIHEELKPTLLAMLQEPSPALFSRAKKVYHKLK